LRRDRVEDAVDPAERERPSPRHAEGDPVAVESRGCAGGGDEERRGDAGAKRDEDCAVSSHTDGTREGVNASRHFRDGV
jgi:hypothetical protein